MKLKAEVKQVDSRMKAEVNKFESRMKKNPVTRAVILKQKEKKLWCLF